MCYTRMNMFLTTINQVVAPAVNEAKIGAIFTITEAIFLALISATLLLYAAPWWQLP